MNERQARVIARGLIPQSAYNVKVTRKGECWMLTERHALPELEKALLESEVFELKINSCDWLVIHFPHIVAYFEYHIGQLKEA